MNEDRAAEGVDHLQRAAREVVAAARSFLDVVEELVEDRAALEEVSAAVSGVAGVLGQAVRRGLDGRPAPWEAAAWGGPPFEETVDVTVDVTDDAASDDPAADRPTGPAVPVADDGDTEPWAATLVTPERPDRRPATSGPAPADATNGADRADGAVRPGSRVRRIVVD